MTALSRLLTVFRRNRSFALAELFKGHADTECRRKFQIPPRFWGHIQAVHGGGASVFAPKERIAFRGVHYKGRYNKNDYFEFLMGLINPEAFMEMEDYYAVC